MANLLKSLAGVPVLYPYGHLQVGQPAADRHEPAKGITVNPDNDGSPHQPGQPHVIEAEEIGDIPMRRLGMLALVICLFSACAQDVPHFEPQTVTGAQCKLTCVDRSAYGRCLEACMDLDRLYKAREAPPK